MQEFFKELFRSREPFWKFWNPGSGLLGGATFAVVMFSSAALSPFLIIPFMVYFGARMLYGIFHQ